MQITFGISPSDPNMFTVLQASTNLMEYTHTNNDIQNMTSHVMEHNKWPYSQGTHCVMLILRKKLKFIFSQCMSGQEANPEI